MNGLPVPPEGGSPSGKTSGNPRGPDQRLGRNQRLIRSAVFQETFAGHNKHVGCLMVLWIRTGNDCALRLGVVTSKKVGNAVKRVKVRRLLREVFRKNREQLTGQCDVVLVGRAGLDRAPWASIEKEFLDLASKAGIYSPP
ncbi:MAG TPA: ribonuclease P protein component [Kiritimatiellia bacterium]|nr:ribonuclease P protein component [Kiritimatiellia bacterium]